MSIAGHDNRVARRTRHLVERMRPASTPGTVVTATVPTTPNPNAIRSIGEPNSGGPPPRRAARWATSAAARTGRRWHLVRQSEQTGIVSSAQGVRRGGRHLLGRLFSSPRGGELVKKKRTLVVTFIVLALLATTASVAVAHSRSNRTVVGAPDRVHMVAREGGEVRWVLPGVRTLDPAIFGTPGSPLRTDLIPEEMRAVNGDVFTTPGPTPFSDNSAPTEGHASVRVTDITSVAGSTTQDKINAKFEFTSPDGEIEYKVVVRDALPEIPDHENFGGVGVNALQHGATGIGTPLMPQLMAFIAFWGKADLYVNGELQNGGENQQRFVHFMLSERVRSSVEDGYTLAFDDGVDPEGSLQAHLIMPPIALTENGPADSPVATGFTLPNGADQPFLHIMYDTVRVTR
jgi:hypothetical protein